MPERRRHDPTRPTITQGYLEDLEAAGGLGALAREVRPWLLMRFSMALDATQKAIGRQLDQIKGIDPASLFPPSDPESKETRVPG